MYRKPKYIRYYRKVARRNEKKRQRTKKLKKRIRRVCIGLSEKKAREFKLLNKRYKHNICAPEIFSFIENPNGVAIFINQLEKCFNKKESVFIHLKNVRVVDDGAVLVLLSVMYDFKNLKIRFNGNHPLDNKLKEYIADTGFFDYLFSESTFVSDYTVNKKNKILTHAAKEIPPKFVEKVVDEASVTIWGDNLGAKGAYITLVDLIDNTYQWAAGNGYKGQKYWWLYVKHDQATKRVSFAFLDHGIGIFESLKQPGSTMGGLWKQLERKFGILPDERLLEKLLLKEERASATGLPNRGRGLPRIKSALDRKQISSLYIISNSVFANVEKLEYRKLETGFRGAYFYWELSNVNIR